MKHIQGAGWAVALLALSACGQNSASGPEAGGEVEVKAVSQTGTAPATPAAAASPAPAAIADATATTAPAAATKAFSAELTGAWAGDVLNCNSGEAVTFFADGTYGMEGEGGRWRLDGDKLLLSGITQFEMGEAGEVAVPDRTMVITQLTDEAMAWRAEDGFEASFARCPG